MHGVEVIPDEALEAATEFGVFRRNGDESDAPMNHFTYTTRDRAETAMQRYAGWDEWLEIRARAVTKWAVVKCK